MSLVRHEESTYHEPGVPFEYAGTQYIFVTYDPKCLGCAFVDDKKTGSACANNRCVGGSYRTIEDAVADVLVGKL